MSSPLPRPGFSRVPESHQLPTIMKRIPNVKLLLCALALIFATSGLATSARAQEHQHQHADSTRAIPMGEGGMMDMDHMQAMMPQMMRMHEHMMADSVLHQRMMADPDMRTMMQEMMGGEMDMAAMRERMAAMSPDERQAKMQQMHAGMMERMEAMPADERQAKMQQMMEGHRRMMADPEVRERMMANPEMRRMMERMGEGGMMEHGSTGGMDSSGDANGTRQGMDHSNMPGMNHSQASGMDHSQMGGSRMQGMDHGNMPGMNHSQADGMDHSQMGGSQMQGMDHSNMPGMDHSQMQGADHSQMSGMDHTVGVAMQRRNAGAPSGSERRATPTVGQAEFDASATADRFHAILASGDRAAMEALLAPDAVVLEGGNHESRAEYLSHHFARDAEFLAGTTPESLYRRTTVAGDAAWVASTQRIGDSEMAELIVMKQTPDGWRVAAVHWSSGR